MLQHAQEGLQPPLLAQARQQPAWRLHDRTPADATGLYDPCRPWQFDGLRDSDFRTGEHGLVEWTTDGEDFVKQVLPPWISGFSFPVESLIAEMDYAGIDRALLHRTPYMGLDDSYIADCSRKYPGRIQGLAQVPEWWLPARMDDAIEELQLLGAWMDRFSEVEVIMTHGFPWRMFSDGDQIHIPEEVYSAAALHHPRFHIQILFAVFLQSRWDYPMPQMRPVLEEMVEYFGADRILWGTDVPIVLLHWTYRQSLDYVRNYCSFLNEQELAAILGGNMKRILGSGK